MSMGISFGKTIGTDNSEFNFEDGGCTTFVSPLKIPSAKTITALIIVLLFVETEISTCGWKEKSKVVK